MLNGYGELVVKMELNRNPSKAWYNKPRDCFIGTLSSPLMVRRCLWSLSERPRSSRRLKLFWGELKKALPVLSMAFDNVYDTRVVAHLAARSWTESVMPL